MRRYMIWSDTVQKKVAHIVGHVSVNCFFLNCQWRNDWKTSTTSHTEYECNQNSPSEGLLFSEYSNQKYKNNPHPACPWISPAHQRLSIERPPGTTAIPHASATVSHYDFLAKIKSVEAVGYQSTVIPIVTNLWSVALLQSNGRKSREDSSGDRLSDWRSVSGCWNERPLFDSQARFLSERRTMTIHVSPLAELSLWHKNSIDTAFEIHYNFPLHCSSFRVVPNYVSTFENKWSCNSH